MRTVLRHLAFMICTAGLLTAFHLQSAHSQTVSANTGTANATATVLAPRAAALLVRDEPYALFDGLVRELRNGGYVIYLRHGAVLPGTIDRIGRGAWWQDCANTQRLGPEALPHARAIAEALVRQRIIVHEVLTSEFCRAVDTSALFGLVAAKQVAALNDVTALPDNQPQTLARYAAEIQMYMSNPPQAKGNRVLIGHALPVNTVHPALSYLPEGHTAIFRAEGNGRFHYLTSISPGQWQWLGKQMVQDQINAALAQNLAGSPQVAPAVPPPASQVLIAPEKELKGIPLVHALRHGGFNLYMRHTQSNVGQDGNLLQTPYWWENCSIQRNISDLGKEQARKVGAALRELKIPVGRVLTAQFCRTRETGHLLGLGPIEVTEDINHQIGQRAGFDVNVARFKRLAESPSTGANNLLVSHTHGSQRLEERIMSGIQEAEVVVFQPDSKGGAEPVARIPLPEWEVLIKSMSAPGS